MSSTPGPRSTGGVVAQGMRVVWQGIRQEPRIFILSIVGSIVYGAGTAGSGWLFGRITEDILAPAFAAGTFRTDELLTAVGLLAIAAVLTAAGVVVRRAAAGITMFRLQARYRRAITRRYLRLPLTWHHRHPAGELLSIANADVEATWQVFAPLPMSLGVLVMVLVAAVAMLAADPVLGAIGLGVLPALVAVNAAYQRRMSPLVMRGQALRGEVSSVAHESFEGAQVVKSLGREQAETDRFAVQADALRDANVAVGRLRGLFDPTIEALPTLGTLAVLAVGAGRVGSGATTTADVVQIVYILALVAFPIRSIGWVLGELPRTVVGWQRMSTVLQATGAMEYGSAELPAARPGDGAGPGPGATLATREVGYAYHGADGERFPVLHGITLDVEPGATVAVVGPTGSGKSTLAGLLVRLVDPASGQVLLDGVDLRTLRQGAVSDAAAVVTQSVFVFDDTVRGNVSLGEAGIDDERVWQALRTARVAAEVRALPRGLDSRIGERGSTLSGGQRQRIALARALVRRPRLLVLDDATSAVDPRVESEILGALRSEKATTVVIAYRMATIALADEVVYLEHGRLVGRGSHAELMSSVTGYRNLVTAYQRDAADRQGVSR